MTPTSEPTEFPAGDTVQWTRELSDYKASDGWQLTYAFRGERGDGKLDLVASADASTYYVTILAQDSAKMRPGLWMWEAYVTKATERHRVGKGNTRVTPNLAATNFATDLRTDAKKAYDNAMEAWQQVKLGKSVSLNGRVYTQHDIEDLILYVDRCRSDWANEQAAVTAGGADHPAGGDPRKIYVRLGRAY